MTPPKRNTIPVKEHHFEEEKNTNSPQLERVYLLNVLLYIDSLQECKKSLNENGLSVTSYFPKLSGFFDIF